MKKRILNFAKGEVVLIVALLLGIISMLLVRPNEEYIDYIDYRVLVLLYSLMLVVGGLKNIGVFRTIGEGLCSKTKNSRQLTMILTLLCFFCSMFITNDVSLITFVPFTISIFAMTDLEDRLIPVITVETIAANLGSMFTPIGNPQNLLIYSKSNMTVMSFLKLMLKPTLLSLALTLFIVFIIKNKKINIENRSKEKNEIFKNYKFWIYIILFIVCLGNVFHLYSYWIVFFAVTFTILAIDRSLFTKVDYSLLFTFVGFFIFIGNMKHLDTFTGWISKLVTGHELEVGILSSQIISNVPAAMLLSGFTDNYERLLLGVDIGGLGTLIASMASLISYRFFAKAYPQKKGKYFLCFTIYNVILLIVLYLCFA